MLDSRPVRSNRPAIARETIISIRVEAIASIPPRLQMEATVTTSVSTVQPCIITYRESPKLRP